MKRAVTAILAILYMTVASGVEMNIHYCMGEIASVDYGKATDEDCNKCGMKNKSGCCEDESRIIKIEDNHHATVLGWIINAPAIFPITFILPGATSLPLLAFSHPSGMNDPPDLSSPPVYLRNRVFRI